MKHKGIILSGGRGTRLYPSTSTVNKQLLPVYDKPMIYYPLSTLMLMGIKEVLIISTLIDTPRFEKLLGNGSQLGMKFSYEVQNEPNGIAEAFIIGEKFIENSPVTLILGDNLFYGHGYLDFIKEKLKKIDGAIIFGYKVKDPEKFGVIEFDGNRRVKKIIEKPNSFVSNWAVTGLYIYDHNAPQIAKELKKSDRGEYEITDLNNLYIKEGSSISEEIIGWWIDAGTPERIEELESKLV